MLSMKEYDHSQLFSRYEVFGSTFGDQLSNSGTSSVWRRYVQVDLQGEESSPVTFLLYQGAGGPLIETLDEDAARDWLWDELQHSSDCSVYIFHEGCGCGAKPEPSCSL